MLLNWSSRLGSPEITAFSSSAPTGQFVEPPGFGKLNRPVLIIGWSVPLVWGHRLQFFRREGPSPWDYNSETALRTTSRLARSTVISFKFLSTRMRSTRSSRRTACHATSKSSFPSPARLVTPSQCSWSTTATWWQVFSCLYSRPTSWRWSTTTSPGWVTASFPFSKFFRMSWNSYYEVQLTKLQGVAQKSKTVYVYLTDRQVVCVFEGQNDCVNINFQVTIREFYLKLIPHKLATFRVAPHVTFSVQVQTQRRPFIQNYLNETFLLTSTASKEFIIPVQIVSKEEHKKW